MPVEIVHPLPPDLLEPVFASALKAYLEPPPADPPRMGPWRQRAIDLDRVWAAREHGRVVGTLRTIADTVSVPGPPGGPARPVDADLLSLVSVSPTHRRQGLLTRMVGESLTEARERGEAVSVLVAAEWAIYGRFGYAPAVSNAVFDVDRRRAGARLLESAPVGTLREIEPVEASELAPPTYAAEVALRAGLIGRDEHWWDRALGRVGPDRAVVPWPHEPGARSVVHLDPEGAVDGYVRWWVMSAEDGPDGPAAVQVEDLFTTTPTAYRELWRMLLGIDLVGRVRFPRRPVDDPLPWLLVDARSAAVTAVKDAMWLRILDVPAALSARGYAAADELVLDVVDPAVGHWAGGRFRLTTGPDGAQCVPAPEATPDLRLPQSTLASLYLGGVRAAVLGRLGGYDEETPGAGVRLDRLFATPLAPWRGTDF